MLIERKTKKMKEVIMIEKENLSIKYGHPMEVTCVKQAVEITLQLRGEAGKRQIEGVQIGITHNVGGSCGTAVVNIFNRER